MRALRTLAVLTLSAGIGAGGATAQAAPESRGASPGAEADVAEPGTALGGPGADFRTEVLGHFRNSAFKISELSRAVPDELYGWSPGEGVMSVGRVYMHLARYNYMYLDQNLGIAPPGGLDYSGFEEIEDPARVRELWEASVEHVRESVSALSEQDLAAATTLYGREVPGWAVLLQLVSHMNEHVGQSVAYARMNGIVPPWSR